MRTGMMAPVTAATIVSLLPNGTKLEQTGFVESGLFFFPNGTSTGGQVVLAAVDGRRAVNVDWLTGRVTVAALP